MQIHGWQEQDRRDGGIEGEVGSRTFAVGGGWHVDEWRRHGPRPVARAISRSPPPAFVRKEKWGFGLLEVPVLACRLPALGFALK